MIFLDDIRTYLVEQGIEIPLYIANMPPTPTTCITLFEYSGLVPRYNQTRTPGLQLLMRCTPDTYEASYNTLYEAAKALEKIGDEYAMPEGAVINGSLYLRIYSTASGFMPLGKDDNGNILVSKNFYVVIGGM